MRRQTKFLFNGSLLAATSLLLRLTGLGFSAYISVRLGAEGTGLLSLVTTVYGFGITLAVSGIYLACIRLCSAAITKNDSYALHTAMQKSFLHAAFFGCLSFFLLFNCANYIGNHFLDDERTVEAIQVLAIALPFIAATTVTDAYFTSVGRVYKSAVSDIAEETVKILSCILLLKSALPFGTKACVVAVTKGNCIGEIAAFFISAVLYYFDIKKEDKSKNRIVGQNESLLRISLPIAFSTYARSGLVTLEHALIPKGLQAYGAGKSDALSAYGIVRGMALPVILFPASILSSFSGLLIPEITEDHVKNDKKAIDRKASLSMSLSCVFAVISAVTLFAYGDELGFCIYNNAAAGRYIRYFSFLIPFMYCDTTADSMLKGLDKQVYTMIVNIADAAMSVCMTGTLIPKFGLVGYIVTVFITEMLNFSFSVGKLVNIVQLVINPLQTVIFPLASTAVFTTISKQVLRFLKISVSKWFCVCGISISLIMSIPIVFSFSFPDLRRRFQSTLFVWIKNTAEPLARSRCDKSADLIR